MYDVADNFLKEYLLKSKVISTYIRNNRLVVFEDEIMNKWILKIHTTNNVSQIIFSISIQKKLSLKGLAPSIVKNNSNSIYTLFQNQIGFVQVYLSNDSIKLVCLDKVLNKIDQLHSEMKSIDIESSDTYFRDSKVDYPIVKDVFFEYIDEKKKFLKMYGEELNSKITLESQLIHGDLRPENVVNNGNDIYFIDFEYSKLGFPEVEKLKFHLLWKMGEKVEIKNVIDKIKLEYSYNSFVLLAKEVLTNNYLFHNWNKISHSYREQVINEHTYLIRCVEHYLRGNDN